jgi:hypothetical protein
MDEDKFICIPLYFAQPPANGFLYQFWELIKFIKQNEKKDITNWEFSTAEHIKAKMGKSLDNGNAVFYKNIIEKYNDDLFYLTVFFMKNGTNVLVHPDVDVSFKKYYTNRNYGMIYLQILKQQQDIFSYAIKLIKDCFSMIKIEYGFICEMERMKLPYAYFHDIGSDKLTEEDRNNMRIWIKNRSYFNSIIRELYMGNILTTKHLNNDRRNLLLLEKEIKDLGIKTEWINDDTLFFLDEKLMSNDDNVRDKVKAMIIKHSGKFMV